MPSTFPGSVRRSDRQLHVGFVPLVDCAPLVAAYELGLFAAYGLDVVLHRELGWATVRDKILYGELDAAHAVAGMAVAATCGWGSISGPCVTAIILSANGNAITLSQRLYDAGVRDAKTFRRYLVESDAEEVPTLGIVSPFSSHNFLLRQWLRSGGINPDRDVRLVIVPPPQVCDNLKAGNLDGFCAGEPWNSLSVQRKLGWTAATSLEVAPGHPEKILIVRERFAEERGEQHLAMVAAILEACAWCDQRENTAELARMLAGASYLNLPAKVLLPCLSGRYDYGHGKRESHDGFITFHRDNANAPTAEKADWIAEHLTDNGFFRTSKAPRKMCERLFRHDLYEDAHALASAGRLVRRSDLLLQPEPKRAPVATATRL